MRRIRADAAHKPVMSVVDSRKRFLSAAAAALSGALAAGVLVLTPLAIDSAQASGREPQAASTPAVQEAPATPSVPAPAGRDLCQPVLVLRDGVEPPTGFADLIPTTLELVQVPFSLDGVDFVQYFACSPAA